MSVFATDDHPTQGMLAGPLALVLLAGPDG
jgi:hypothetical protein